MEISPKYDLVPYGQGDHDVLPYRPKNKSTGHGLDLTPMNRQGLLQRPTLCTPSDRPVNIQKTYNSKRGIQHSLINQIGSQVNIYA